MNGIRWDDMPDVMDVEGVATMLGVSQRTVREMFKRGDVYAVKCGDKWRCAKKNLRSFLEGEK